MMQNFLSSTPDPTSGVNYRSDEVNRVMFRKFWKFIDSSEDRVLLAKITKGPEAQKKEFIRFLWESFTRKEGQDQGSELTYNSSSALNSSFVANHTDKKAMVGLSKVSRVIGDWVKVKDNYRNFTEKYYHISRFRTKKQLEEKEESMSSFVNQTPVDRYPHKFKAGLKNMLAHAEGQVVYRLSDLKEFRVKAFYPASGKLKLEKIKHLVPRDMYRLDKNQVKTTDFYNKEVSIGDYVRLSFINSDDVMLNAGWEEVQGNDWESWSYWRNLISNTLAKIVDVVDDGKFVIVNFVNTVKVVESKFAHFNFKVSTKHIWRSSDFSTPPHVPGTQPLPLPAAGNTENFSRYRKEREERERKEAEEKAKEEAEKKAILDADIAAGPYPGLEKKFLDKIVRIKNMEKEDFNGEHGIVINVDEESGRISVKFIVSKGTERKLFFRASLKAHEQNMDIVSNLIVSDEGKEDHV